MNFGKQLLKEAIDAALHRVTQLSGHGFANINAFNSVFP